MKKFYLIATLAMSALLCGALSACGGDEPDNPDEPDTPPVVNPDKPTPDPENTVTVNLLNNGDDAKISLGEGIRVYIDPANNLCGYDGEQLLSVGTVAGLGNITGIPEGEWKSAAAVVPGTGYVVRSASTPYKFARLFVVGFMQSTAGGIMGATVKYQCPFVPANLFGGGTGTPTDPYIVKTGKHLDNVRYAPGACFRQTADIDLSSFNDNSSSGWVPIQYFTGQYDGGNHKITNLFVNRRTGGLFQDINSANAMVKGIRLQLHRNGIKAEVSGGICDALYQGTISECSVEGYIEGYDRAGGIAGYSGNSAKIERCFFEGTIKVNYWKDFMGAITGGDADVTDSYAIVTFTGDANKTAFGYGQNRNCYIKTDTENVELGKSESCFIWTTEADADAFRQSTYTGWNFTTVWQINEGRSMPTLRCF